VAGVVLGWQGGGAIGSGRLSSFGVSPWRFGASLGGAVGAAAIAAVAVAAAAGWLHSHRAHDRGAQTSTAAPASVAAVAFVPSGVTATEDVRTDETGPVAADDDDRTDDTGQLAG
jgi:hypothetical protein